MSELVHFLNNDLTEATKDRIRDHVRNKIEALLQEPTLSTTKVSFLLCVGQNSVVNRLKTIKSLEQVVNMTLDHGRVSTASVDSIANRFAKLTDEQKQELLARLTTA